MNTIIFDASALMQMECPVSEFCERSTHQPKHHVYDILPVLARQGCQIIIPEESVYQLTHAVVVDGKLKPINSYFGGKYKAGNLPFYKAERDLLRFFEAILSHKYPGIEIVPSDGVDSNDYLASIKDVMRRHPHTNDATRKELIELQKDDHTGFEWRAVEAHVREISKEELVVVVAMNRRMLEDINRNFQGNTKLAMVDMPGFVQAMSENGIFQRIGIPATLPHRELSEIMHTNAANIMDHDTTLPVDIIDSSPTDPNARPRYKNDRPFATAINALAQELGHDPADGPDVAPAPKRPHYPNSGTQIARFRAREAKRAELRGEKPPERGN